MGEIWCYFFDDRYLNGTEHFFEGITPLKDIGNMHHKREKSQIQSLSSKLYLSNPYNRVLILYGNVPLMHKCKNLCRFINIILFNSYRLEYFPEIM